MENRCERIATLVTGGETPAQIKERYEELLRDISLIDSGHYRDLTDEMAAAEEMTAATKVDGGTMEHTTAVDGYIRTAWTEEEQRLFFTGLKQGGKDIEQGFQDIFVVYHKLSAYPKILHPLKCHRGKEEKKKHP